jgi:hypothetical protein
MFELPAHSATPYCDHFGDVGIGMPPVPGPEPVLSERQSGILRALRNMNAASPESRQTTEALAQEAEGSWANPDGFKEPVSGLKRVGLIGTKNGRGGGCWLTSGGLALIDRIIDRESKRNNQPRVPTVSPLIPERAAPKILV